LPRLRKLLLSRCKGITDEGLSCLGKAGRLQFLAVDGTSVTADGVEAFRATHPKCRVSGP
jgi:hypothetical protein